MDKLFSKKTYHIIVQRLSKQRLHRRPEPESSTDDQEIIKGNLNDGLNGSLAVVYGIISTILDRYDFDNPRNALDIGTGTGILLAKLAQLFPETSFTGIDISQAMLEIAQETTKKYKNIYLMLCNLHNLKATFDGKTFDLITWSLGLHHLKNNEEASKTISMLTDLLSPHGRLFIFDIERPKTLSGARFLADTFNNKYGYPYYQDSLNSYLAAFSYQEMEEIIKAASVKTYLHKRPFFINIFQYVIIPGARIKPKAQRHRPEFHYQGNQLFDYKLLKLAFGL